MKSFPYVPGYVLEPNSAPDSSTPSHLNFPAVPVALVVGRDVVVVVFVVVDVVVFNVVDVDVVVFDVVVDVVLFTVVGAEPGKHWLYQSFW